MNIFNSKKKIPMMIWKGKTNNLFQLYHFKYWYQNTKLLILYTRIQKKKSHIITHYKICVHNHCNIFFLIWTHQLILSGSPPTCLWFSHHLYCRGFSLKSNSSLWKKSSPVLPAVLTECICCSHWGCTSSDMLWLLFILACCSFLPCFLKCSWKDTKYKLHNYT